MSAPKRLIINADDFGVSRETNKAVTELYKGGKITSASLLVTADASEEAMSLIKELDMSFGVHLTLNSDFAEYPWGALSKGSLADPDGFLFKDTAYIAKNALSKDVTDECDRQLALALAAGLAPDHLDNHSGTMYGINMRLFFINAFKMAGKHKLPFRFPKRNDFLKGYFKNGAPAYIRAAHKAITWTAKLYGCTLIDDLITNPYPIKDIKDYDALADYYLTEITAIKEGVTEMFLHPSYDVPKFSAITPEWRKRQYELDFLWSPALERRLLDEGIELVSYKALAKS